jgi:hypothetical protein
MGRDPTFHPERRQPNDTPLGVGELQVFKSSKLVLEGQSGEFRRVDKESSDYTVQIPFDLSGFFRFRKESAGGRSGVAEMDSTLRIGREGV